MTVWPSVAQHDVRQGIVPGQLGMLNLYLLRQYQALDAKMATLGSLNAFLTAQVGASPVPCAIVVILQHTAGQATGKARVSESQATCHIGDYFALWMWDA